MSDTYTTSCESCGSTVRYLPGTTELHCQTCGAEQNIASLDTPVAERSVEELAGTLTPVADLGASELNCRSCGAITLSDQLSTACQFCGGVLVVVDAPDGVIRPDGVLPFEIDAAQATNAFREWISGQRLAPEEVRQLTDAGTLTGTYLPMWDLDLELDITYSGRVRDGDTWSERSGTVRRRLERLEAPASESIGRLLQSTGGQDVASLSAQQQANFHAGGGFEFLNDFVMSRLGPWDLKKSRPFQPEFLVGYSTLRYDVTPQEAVDAAIDNLGAVVGQSVIVDMGAAPAFGLPELPETIEGAGMLSPMLRSLEWKDMSGDDAQIDDVEVTVADATVTQVLLPVWVGGYVYEGRRYPVHVNARTGEVEGPRTLSKVVGRSIKIALLLPLVVIVGIVVAIQVLLF